MLTEAPVTTSIAPIIERRRRGRRPHVPMTLDQMRRPEGRPIVLRCLMDLTGFTKHKLIADIKGGYLRAFHQANPETGEELPTWWVHYHEAQRYLKAVGIL